MFEDPIHIAWSSHPSRSVSATGIFLLDGSSPCVNRAVKNLCAGVLWGKFDIEKLVLSVPVFKFSYNHIEHFCL